MRARTSISSTRVALVAILAGGLSALGCTKLRPGADFPDAEPRDATASAPDLGTAFDARVDDARVSDAEVPDAGVEPDSGAPPDGGIPGVCARSEECPGDNAVCVEDTPEAYVLCRGGACRCATACDFDRVFESCLAPQVCGFAGGPSDISGTGLCTQPTGGGRHGNPCTVSAEGSDCEEGHVCRTPGGSRSGLCARRCAPSRPSVCEALGPFECVPSPFQPSHGYCLIPPETFSDIGAECATSGECDGVCVGFPGPQQAAACSDHCGGLDACPIGSHCLSGYCLLDCGDADPDACGVNGSLTCGAFLGAAFCFGRCTVDGDCIAPLTCELATQSCR